MEIRLQGIEDRIRSAPPVPKRVCDMVFRKMPVPERVCDKMLALQAFPRGFVTNNAC